MNRKRNEKKGTFHLMKLRNWTTFSELITLTGLQSSSSPTDMISFEEEEAVDNLMKRLTLIMMEDGWSRPSYARKFIGKNSEPW